MQRRYGPEGDTIRIEGWAVQVLPVFKSLTQEALEQAVEHTLCSTTIRVFTAEHLAAIMLDTGRPKDFLRLLQFIEQGILEQEKFEEIVARHHLIGKWLSFKARFLSGKV